MGQETVDCCCYVVLFAYDFGRFSKEKSIRLKRHRNGHSNSNKQHCCQTNSGPQYYIEVLNLENTLWGDTTIIGLLLSAVIVSFFLISSERAKKKIMSAMILCMFKA